MQGPPPQMDQKKSLSLDQWFNLFYHVSIAASSPFRALLRVPGTMGDRSNGMHAALGMMVHSVLISSYNPTHGVVYFWATLAGFAVHALASPWRPRRTHSTYDGDSSIAWLLGLDSYRFKTVWEPVLLAVVAFLVYPFSPGLGVAVGLGMVGWCFQVTAHQLERKAKKRAMTDARIEYEELTGRRPEAGEMLGDAPANPRRALAKRVLVVCLLALAWQLFGDAFARMRAVRLQPRHQRPYVARQSRADSQRAAWRRWNTGYGGY